VGGYKRTIFGTGFRNHHTSFAGVAGFHALHRVR